MACNSCLEGVNWVVLSTILGFVKKHYCPHITHTAGVVYMSLVLAIICMLLLSVRRGQMAHLDIPEDRLHPSLSFSYHATGTGAGAGASVALPACGPGGGGRKMGRYVTIRDMTGGCKLPKSLEFLAGFLQDMPTVKIPPEVPAFLESSPSPNQFWMLKTTAALQTGC